jgi:hypothetical protein
MFGRKGLQQVLQHCGNTEDLVCRLKDFNSETIGPRGLDEEITEWSEITVSVRLKSNMPPYLFNMS